MKSRRSRATDIPPNIKKVVWERDGHRCIFCGSSQAMPNAHVISRAKGGLGVEENIVTACYQCHFNMDQTSKRQEYLDIANRYLDQLYGHREDLIYKK